MFRRTLILVPTSFLLIAVDLIPQAAAQKQPAGQSAVEVKASAGAESPRLRVDQVVVPAGTRLPLLLRNGINTRTAKAGDSVYFETLYPIAQDGRIVIPLGSFVRGQVVSVKRPGRIKGRGEIRLQLESLTFPNGYVAALNATPGSVDRDGKEGVDSEGTIKGRSSVGKDVGIVALGTLGGFYLGNQVGFLTAIADNPGRAVSTGAAVGAGVGMLAGLSYVLVSRGPEAELPRGTTLDFVFDRPLALDADHLPAPGQTADRDPLQPTPFDRDEGSQGNTSKKQQRRRLMPRILPDLR